VVRRRDEFVLRATLAAPGRARRLIAAACEGLDAAKSDVAQLLTSELVTNAVLHPPLSASAASGDVQVTLVVDREADGLRVEVQDHDPRPVPRAPPPESFRESGWGLQLVAQLSSSWGSRELPDGSGKAVWFELRNQQSG
jgi:anti-sigma regulatory factor (Ser/Thr protein kinase)